MMLVVMLKGCGQVCERCRDVRFIHKSDVVMLHGFNERLGHAIALRRPYRRGERDEPQVSGEATGPVIDVSRAIIGQPLDLVRGFQFATNLSAFLWARRLINELPARLRESIAIQDSKLAHGRLPVEGRAHGLRQDVA